jgi:hypothetical protein
MHDPNIVFITILGQFQPGLGHLSTYPTFYPTIKLIGEDMEQVAHLGSQTTHLLSYT